MCAFFFKNRIHESELINNCFFIKLHFGGGSGGPPMAPGGGNATIFEEDGSGNGSGEVEVEEFRFEDI
ncbi:unnamed protein product [Rhizophagus irregularis]|nr:unnamed protein product [Rhizophagus irregularis]